jgi:phage gpG-like protein
VAEALVRINVDDRALRQARDMLQRYPQTVLRALEEGLQAIALEVQKTAVVKLTEQGAVDTGCLRASITIHSISDTNLVVGTNVAYAAAVEYGAKGHWIRIDKTPGFRAWLRHHGIDPKGKMVYFWVAPKPRPYMEPAFEAGRALADKEIPHRVEQALRTVSGGAG